MRPSLPSAPYSLPPQRPFRPILPSAAPYSLPPRPRFRPGPGRPRFRPRLASAPASLPPQPPFRPMLLSAPASLQLVGVRGCLSAEVECDGAALASCSVSMCECASECVAARRLIRCRVVRPWLRGVQCLHVRIRWNPTNGLEQELWLTHLWHGVCVTNPARPAPTRS